MMQEEAALWPVPSEQPDRQEAGGYPVAVGGGHGRPHVDRGNDPEGSAAVAESVKVADALAADRHTSADSAMKRDTSRLRIVGPCGT